MLCMRSIVVLIIIIMMNRKPVRRNCKKILRPFIFSKLKVLDFESTILILKELQENSLSSLLLDFESLQTMDSV